MPRFLPTRAVAVAAGLLTVSRPAEAHIVLTRLGDFYAGALHPLTGAEDMVLWLALGLLAGQQNVRRARWVIPAFPLALLAGLAAEQFGLLPALPSVADPAAMALLGGLLAAAAPLTGPILPAVAVVVGVLRGAANATGIGPDTNAALFMAGTTLASYALVTLMAAATVAFRSYTAPWRQIAILACGSWIAAVGLMLGGYTLAGH